MITRISSVYGLSYFRKNMRQLLSLLGSALLPLLLFYCNNNWASSLTVPATLKVAVSTDFHHTLHDLAEKFEKKTHTKVVLTEVNLSELDDHLDQKAAKFDMIAMADSLWADELEREGKILPGSKRVYAYGRLAFWHKQNQVMSPDDVSDHIYDNQPKIILTNDTQSAYGDRVYQYFQDIGVAGAYQNKTSLIVKSKAHDVWEKASEMANATAILPASLVIHDADHDEAVHKYHELEEHEDPHDHGDHVHKQMIDDHGDVHVHDYPNREHVTLIPDEDFQPIKQTMAIMDSSHHKDEAKLFADFILSEASQNYIADHGYYRADRFDRLFSDDSGQSSSGYSLDDVVISGVLTGAVVLVVSMGAGLIIWKHWKKTKAGSNVIYTAMDKR